jgi:Arc/MetJ-type ribon-helix-helix transcriptional regulator
MARLWHHDGMRKARPKTTVVLTEADDERLDRAAAARGDSRSSVVRRLIREHLGDETQPVAASSMPKVRA